MIYPLKEGEFYCVPSDNHGLPEDEYRYLFEGPLIGRVNPKYPSQAVNIREATVPEWHTNSSNNLTFYASRFTEVDVFTAKLMAHKQEMANG